MTRKHELTDETKVFDGVTVHRIRALVNIPRYGVKVGDLGGFVEKESNLSHNGECWIGNNACVYDNARIYGNAFVYDNASVFGEAWIFGNTRVCNKARIYGNTHVYGNACVFSNALVYDNARVFGNAWIYENACVSGEAWIHGNSYIYGNALIYDNTRIYGNSRVYGNACIYGNACVCGNACISQGKYHVSTMHITVLPYNITAIYPNHVQIGCKLFKICDKETAIETMREFDISEEYHKQIWLAVRLCKRWLKDNPEKEITNA